MDDQIAGSASCANSALEARSLASGSPLWTIDQHDQQGNRWLIAPVLVGDTVYVAANATTTQGPVDQGEHDLLALDAATQTIAFLPIRPSRHMQRM